MSVATVRTSPGPADSNALAVRMQSPRSDPAAASRLARPAQSGPQLGRPEHHVRRDWRIVEHGFQPVEAVGRNSQGGSGHGNLLGPRTAELDRGAVGPAAQSYPGRTGVGGRAGRSQVFAHGRSISPATFSVVIPIFTRCRSSPLLLGTDRLGVRHVSRGEPRQVSARGAQLHKPALRGGMPGG